MTAFSDTNYGDYSLVDRKGNRHRAPENVQTVRVKIACPAPA